MTTSLIGFPVVDVRVVINDGQFHAVDSSQMAFEAAGRAAFRQTMPKAGPQLLEPIMKVDVFVPDANVGDVIGDLNRRRGMMKSQEPGATNVRIKADVPLGEMFGYIGDLRSATRAPARSPSSPRSVSGIRNRPHVTVSSFQRAAASASVNCWLTSVHRCRLRARWSP